jgi:hypothetical protein
MSDDSDIRRRPTDWRICELLQHSGLGFSSDERERVAAEGLSAGGRTRALTDPVAGLEQISIEGIRYRIDRGQPRPQLIATAAPPRRVREPVRVHAGLHKCLTMYTRRVYEKLCKSAGRGATAFRHFYHRDDHFNHLASRYLVASLSGHAIDLDRFDDVRVVRFIRDPRDLLVSGYFYHLRAKEPWCELSAPTDSDWRVVNACVPQALGHGESLTSYLNRVPVTEGLLAEIEVRRRHFDSMLRWIDDPRVRVYRYEDILGNEASTFAEVARFLGLPLRARLHARRYANRFRAGQRHAQSGHIRNPAAGQWQHHFTPAVERAFTDTHGALLARYGYQ